MSKHIREAATLLPLVCSLLSCSDTTAPRDGSGPPRTENIVASIQIVGAKPIQQGGAVALSALVLNSNGAQMSEQVVWQSSDTTIAKVSALGIVTGVGRTGTVTITATAGGKTATAAMPAWWVYQPAVSYLFETVRELTITDAARGRPISIYLRIPNGAPQPLPVVIMPGGPPSGKLGDNWPVTYRARGYAVVLVKGAAVDAQSCIEFGVPDAECNGLIIDPSGPNSSPLVPLLVAKDLSSALSNLSNIATMAGVQLDAGRVAVSGVSRGAQAVLHLAGATVDLTPTVKNVSVKDSRFAAYMANSPPGTNSTGPACGCNSDSWKNVTGAVMSQTSSGDIWGRREPFDRMPAGNKFLAFYESQGVDHLAFTMEWSVLPPPSPLTAYIPIIAVAFADAYLRGNVDAQEWLRTNALGRGTEVQVSNK
jgi:hypothetical protein